eukprot:1419741-Pyramimonas_sp.AAC.1
MTPTASTSTWRAPIRVHNGFPSARVSAWDRFFFHSRDHNRDAPPCQFCLRVAHREAVAEPPRLGPCFFLAESLSPPECLAMSTPPSGRTSGSIGRTTPPGIRLCS